MLSVTYKLQKSSINIPYAVTSFKRLVSISPMWGCTNKGTHLESLFADGVRVVYKDPDTHTNLEKTNYSFEEF